MGFAAKGFKIECTLAPPQFVSQRSEACAFNGVRAQDKTLRAFLKFESNTRLYAEHLNNPGR